MSAGDTSGLKLRFWGVRGSLPAPGPDTVKYGGNTTCITVEAGEDLIIFDAGSGARALGIWMHETGRKSANLYFTHFHLDHICGLPFFRPGMIPGFDITLWAGHVADPAAFIESIESLMSPPVFPVSTEILQSITFCTFKQGDTLKPVDGVTLQTMALNHPGGCTGYRLEAGGKSICIITDYEHGTPEFDDRLADFVRDADIMVYDAMFNDEEFAKCRGWGHSTWDNCLKVAKACNVARPVIFHHDPGRTDTQLDRIAKDLDRRYPGTIVAREGAELMVESA